mmetsp:Transcript_11493/g.35712  ORF Transcript_11493/g.35712 Transcript_11493/m.35712 type:complete len:329 (+) Transcript_11493:866-1852(+)
MGPVPLLVMRLPLNQVTGGRARPRAVDEGRMRAVVAPGAVCPSSRLLVRRRARLRVDGRGNVPVRGGRPCVGRVRRARLGAGRVIRRSYALRCARRRARRASRRAARGFPRRVRRPKRQHRGAVVVRRCPHEPDAGVGIDQEPFEDAVSRLAAVEERLGFKLKRVAVDTVLHAGGEHAFRAVERDGCGAGLAAIDGAAVAEKLGLDDGALGVLEQARLAVGRRRGPRVGAAAAGRNREGARARKAVGAAGFEGACRRVLRLPSARVPRRGDRAQRRVLVQVLVHLHVHLGVRRRTAAHHTPRETKSERFVRGHLPSCRQLMCSQKLEN